MPEMQPISVLLLALCVKQALLQDPNAQQKLHTLTESQSGSPASVDLHTNALNLFDRVIFINLDRRHDRRAHMMEELGNYGVLSDKILRLPAIENKAEPWRGCTCSHLKALEMAKANKFKSIVIMEDDFKFLLSNEETNSAITEVLKELKDDWDVLMLSANMEHGKDYVALHGNRVLGNLRQVKGAQTASGYAVNGRFFDPMIANAKIACEDTRPGRDGKDFDQTWKSLQNLFLFFRFEPKLGYQMKSYSDLEKKITTYNTSLIAIE